MEKLDVLKKSEAESPETYEKIYGYLESFQSSPLPSKRSASAKATVMEVGSKVDLKLKLEVDQEIEK